jgi:hypothetical protein
VSFANFREMVLSYLKSRVGKGAKIGLKMGKVAVKKGYKGGKKIGITTAKTGGRLALQHGNSLVDTAIRGAGVAATATAGNPAPLFGAEGVIMGKDRLLKAAGKTFMGGSGRKSSSATPKSQLYYSQLAPKNPSLRNRAMVGVASQSHNHGALSRMFRARVNTSAAAGRNLDYFSSATRPTGAKM